ncbi:MAG TPA: hypothetical protein VKP89_05090 [Burkholderiales bacterium]|nr:hypothetical protein [Burkholderiales bacterium]
MSETATEEARAADTIEAAAYREMYAAAPPELGARLGLETREIDGATLLVARGIPDPFFNRTIGLGLARPAREEDVDAMLAAYRAVKSWWLHLTPGAAPAALVSWLEARGFALAKRRAWAKMVRGTAAPPEVATPLEVRAARAGEEGPLAESIAAGFGMPAAFVP